MFATNGKKYLDFVQGIAVNSLGHSNPGLIKAIFTQSKKVWYVSNSFIIPEGEKLHKRLTKKLLQIMLFSKTVEPKLGRSCYQSCKKIFLLNRKAKKNRILCIKNSFHGRTIAAIYASGSKKMTEGFGPKVPGFDHIEFKNFKPRFPNLRGKIKKNTAAIMVETVMGEGGIKSIPNKCLKYLRKICNEKKILLILDEVQCGIGRSDIFAFENQK